LALLYVAVSKPVYEASTRLVIRQVPPGYDAEATPRTSDKVFLATQAEVLGSPRTIGRALELLPFPEELEPDDDPVHLVAEDLRVNPLVSTDVVRVAFQHHDPRHAVDRLQSLIDSYREQLHAAERTSASESLKLLTQREAELAGQVQELQARLQAVHDQQPLGTAGDGFEDSPLLRELSARWAATQSNRARLNAVLNNLDADAPKFNTSDFDLETLRELSELQTERVRARAARDEARAVYGPSHPERLRAEQRAEATDRELQATRQELQSEYQRLALRTEAELQELATLMEQERDRLRSAGAARLEEERLRFEIAQLSELHGASAATLETVRLADRSLAEGRGLVQVEVLDQFEPPTDPIWPLPLPLVAVSTLLGGLLSAGVLWLLANGDATSLTGGSTAPIDLPRSYAESTAEEAVLHDAQGLHEAVVGGAVGRTAPEFAGTPRGA
jgi:uncharacterized protein involved in exopolysaccharide biosynthesis